jgi:hypothetical protein
MRSTTEGRPEQILSTKKTKSQQEQKSGEALGHRLDREVNESRACAPARGSGNLAAKKKLAAGVANWARGEPETGQKIWRASYSASGINKRNRKRNSCLDWISSTNRTRPRLNRDRDRNQSGMKMDLRCATRTKNDEEIRTREQISQKKNAQTGKRLDLLHTRRGTRQYKWNKKLIFHGRF